MMVSTAIDWFRSISARLTFNLYAAVLLCVVSTHPAQADLVRAYKSGFWDGGAEATSDGVIDFCYLVAQYNQGEYNIYLLWNRLGFHLLLHSSTWNLEAGTDFQGRMRIDKRFDELIPSNIPNTNAIDYIVGFDPRTQSAIQKGSRIRLDGPLGEKTFPLRGTNKAIGTLMDCAKEHGLPLTQEASIQRQPAKLEASISAEVSQTFEDPATSETLSFHGQMELSVSDEIVTGALTGRIQTSNSGSSRLRASLINASFDPETGQLNGRLHGFGGNRLFLAQVNGQLDEVGISGMLTGGFGADSRWSTNLVDPNAQGSSDYMCENHRGTWIGYGGACP